MVDQKLGQAVRSKCVQEDAFATREAGICNTEETLEHDKRSLKVISLD